VSHFRRKAPRTIIPERNPRTGQTTEQRAWIPNHDDHVDTYQRYWDEQGEKLIALSLRLLLLGGIKRKRETAVDLSSDVTIKSEPPRAMVTVNDWAKAEGLALSISQATEVGMRAAKLYEAKYGMPPSQTPSWKGPMVSAYVGDMRRPWKDKGTHYLPQHLLNRVGEYPKAILERAWRMVSRR
jgi:hypothetical protein